MKMNFAVRAKNPVFWMTLIPAVVALVYTILAAFGVVPGVSEDRIIDTACVVISALTTLGVLVDPTTKGVADSARAMTYTSVNDSDMQFSSEEECEEVESEI